MSNFISTHWGTYKFSVDKNQKLSLTNWESYPSPTEFGIGLADAATDDLRIKQPHVRKGWLENKGKSDGRRGRDNFIPVSWDEALKLASDELLETKISLVIQQFMLDLMVGQVLVVFIMLKVK